MFRSPATSGSALTFGFPDTSVRALTSCFFAPAGRVRVFCSPTTSSGGLMFCLFSTSGQELTSGFPATSGR
eukprot:7277110-Prorocentrum_lima.AAC.1